MELNPLKKWKHIGEGLFCLKIPTNSLLVRLLQLLDLCMSLSGSCWVPLLGLSASDECINKIIPSSFLMSAVFWILLQMAGEPRTPQDEAGTPQGAAEQGGVCSRQGRVALSLFYRSAGLSWDRDILHEHPCVRCDNGLRWQQGQVRVCCTAWLCLSGCSSSRWALQPCQHSFGSGQRIPVPSAVEADRIPLYIALMSGEETENSVPALRNKKSSVWWIFVHEDAACSVNPYVQ